MQQVWEMINVLLLIFIGVEAAVDYRKKSISAVCSIIMLVGMAACVMIYGYTDWKNLLCGMLPGAAVVILSIISGQAVGSGDGMILMVIGAVRGAYEAVMVLMFAGLAASVIMLVLLMARKVKKKSTIAFIPYLLAGYVGVMLCV